MVTGLTIPPDTLAPSEKGMWTKTKEPHPFARAVSRGYANQTGTAVSLSNRFDLDYLRTFVDLLDAIAVPYPLE